MYTIDNRKFNIHFGQKGADDYLIHHDSERRDKYLKRHIAETEYWKFEIINMSRPAFWSRHLTWGESTSIQR